MNLGKKILMAESSDIYHDGRILKEATSLVNHGFSVKIFGFRQGKKHHKYNFKILTIPIFPRKYRFFRNLSIAINIILINLMILFIKRDFYHAHNTMFLFGMFISSKLYGGKLIYDSHEVQWEKSKLSGWIESKLIDKVDYVINVCEGRTLQQSKKYGIPKRKIIIIHNYPELSGLEIDSFKPLSINNNLKFVFSGGFNLNDNRLDNFIGVIKDFPELTMDIIGFGYGDSHQKLLNIISDYNMEQQIKILPLVRVEHLIPTLSKYDIAVNLLYNPNNLISYKYHGINKMYEYLLSGLPILTSNMSSFIEEFENCGVGKSVNPLDNESIKIGIQFFVDKKNDLLNMKIAAQQLAIEKFTWSSEELKLIQLYKTLF